MVTKVNYINYICVLCVRPALKTYEFFSAIQRKYRGVYEVIFVVDDDTYVVEPPAHLHGQGWVTVVHIDALTCALAGYKGTHLWLGPERASSRDKALYYFTHVLHLSTDQYVWFLEEDVFVPTVDTIWQIDKQQQQQLKQQMVDLLVSEHTLVLSASDTVLTAGQWHWPHVLATTTLEVPLAKGMICAIRCSHALLAEVAKYAALNKKLFLDEALFNTLALKADLRVQVSEALRGIKWCYNWTVGEMDTEHLYHPVKCIRTQYYLRARLKVKVQVERSRMARVINKGRR